MSSEVYKGVELDLPITNRKLAGETPEKIVEWAVDTFDPDKIYSPTSAGLSAPLTMDLLFRTAKAGISPKIPIIHNDTGFLPDQVHEYLHTELARSFEFKPIVIGPSAETIKYIEETELWEHDKELYRKLTKLDPLSEKIGELGVQALITGVRRDQNRDGLDIVTYGADGEYRINPNFWTPKHEVEESLETMIAEGRVARHPLHLVVDFVDDWQYVGGPKEECGINSVSRLSQVPTFSIVKTA
jgi:3'-phosphoadenosine 5'-phosphosulfate sulfotransferase (PAPS reductase)/FAD synthetase